MEEESKANFDAVLADKDDLSFLLVKKPFFKKLNGCDYFVDHVLILGKAKYKVQNESGIFSACCAKSHCAHFVYTLSSFLGGILLFSTVG